MCTFLSCPATFAGRHGVNSGLNVLTSSVSNVLIRKEQIVRFGHVLCYCLLHHMEKYHEILTSHWRSSPHVSFIGEVWSCGVKLGRIKQETPSFLKTRPPNIRDSSARDYLEDYQA